MNNKLRKWTEKRKLGSWRKKKFVCKLKDTNNKKRCYENRSSLSIKFVKSSKRWIARNVV